MAGVAVAGDPFRLGQLNAIDRISQLVGSTTSAMLRIDNNGTGSALQLLVEPDRPSLTVNVAAGKATNLDADELDGNDSAAFLQSSAPTYAVIDTSTGAEGFLAGASASCDPGDKILDGGFDGLSPGDGVIVSDATASGAS